MALQIQTQIQTLYSLGAAAVAALLLLSAGAARAEPGPFSALAGSWSGSGIIKKSNGTSERVRCRSAFEPAGTANLSLRLRLRCASDSYNFDLSASVAYQGGSISGSFQEATRSVVGGISGHSSGEGRQIQAVAQAPGVTSNITMTIRGNHQSVSIVTPGAEVPEVTVSLEKR
ncbi:MAG TPA: hypothetical protein VKT99_25390 [Xanthobacteraceae bacterium]|jgi:hypothetical protein|nr:hypothetical protein [Xanthobacteraceae bacterium]